jgi:hypothetical protein
MRAWGAVAPASRRQNSNAAVPAALGRKSQRHAGATDVFFSYDHVAIRDRGFLPHWEIDEETYFVTFRLGDSLPQSVLDAIEFERRDIEENAKRQGRGLTSVDEKNLARLYTARIERALDAGSGACHLAKPKVAEMVANALRFFDGQCRREAGATGDPAVPAAFESAEIRLSKLCGFCCVPSWQRRFCGLRVLIRVGQNSGLRALTRSHSGRTRRGKNRRNALLFFRNVERSVPFARKRLSATQ